MSGLPSINLLSSKNLVMVGATATKELAFVSSNAASTSFSAKNLVPGKKTLYYSAFKPTTLLIIFAASSGLA